MSSTVFQIVVAGFLITAWLWVLGRPLLSKISYLIRRMRSHDAGIDYVRPTAASLLGSFLRGGLFRPLLQPIWAWRGQSVFTRRRQTLSFLMLLALSSIVVAAISGGLLWFVPVPALVLLLGYLREAARVGGRIRRWKAAAGSSRPRRYRRSSAIPDASSIRALAFEPNPVQDSTELGTGLALRGRPDASGSGDPSEPIDAFALSPQLLEEPADGESGEPLDLTDPTLEVGGSRRRKPSLRHLFRAPPRRRAQGGSDGVFEGPLYLEPAANDR